MSYGYVPPPPGVPPAPIQSSASRGISQKKLAWIIGITAACLIILFVAGIIVLIFGSMKSSDPYRHAVEVATHDSRVLSALGSPVSPGWLLSGSINVSNASGNADLAIPLKGSVHSGTIYVVAKKSEGVWLYQSLAVRIADTSERIDLLSERGPDIPNLK